ncbi:MAG: putative toxin-antitoxin system toxin component, PIN family [Planctomycetia bacterium]|nr:putative toxin-antitoxin system toxin component, PIN family [Planctomycetia bacterium]
MKSNSRVVFDTNVAVSAALLPESVPRQAFDIAIANARVLVSAATIIELEEVPRRPKFNRYVTEAERLEFLASLVNEAEPVQVRESITASRDPKDDKFLELAVSGHATHVVSGDQDLLTLHPFRGIAIITPQAFLHSSE